MAEYHVGLGMSAIYAGTLNKAGDMWKSKSDVTEEAIKAVFVHLVEEAEVEKPGDEYTITYPSSEYELVIRRKKE